MPKLPIIQAEESMPRRTSYSGPDMAEGGRVAGAWAQGANQVAAAGARIQAQAEAVQEKEREAEDVIDSMTLRTEFGERLAAEDTEMRQRPDFDLKAHSENLKARGARLSAEIAGKAKRPGVASMVRAQNDQTLGTQVVQAKYEYRKNLSSVADAKNLAFQKTQETAALTAWGSGLMKDYDAALKTFDDNADLLAAQGHITPEQAGERKLGLVENIDTARASDAIRLNPATALSALQDRKQFAGLRTSRRETLITRAVNAGVSNETAERRKRTEEEHVAKKAVNQLGLDALRTWDPSTKPEDRLTREEIERRMSDPDLLGVMTMEQGASIRRLMNSDIVAGGADAPGQRSQVALGIAMRDPKFTRESIYNMVSNKKLSAETATKLIDDLEKEKTEKGVSSKEEYKQARDYLTRAMTGADGGILGAVGLGKFLNNNDAARYAAAHETLYREARRIHEKPKPGETLLDLLDFAKRTAGEDKSGGSLNPLNPMAPSQGGTPKPASSSPRDSRDKKRGFGGE